MNWPSIAIRKLNSLINQEDFIQISWVDENSIEIRFKTKFCTIDNSGRVIWI